MVEKLLNAAANPNAALPTGETPLMTCSWTGNAGAVKLLLARGADVHAKETRRGQTALMWALEQKHLEAARVLVEHGADVRARSKSGFTPLLFAAKQGDMESVRVLLAAGANVNEGTPIQNRPTGRRAAPLPDDADPNVPDGVTPLLMASASGHEELSLFLLENGANPNAADGTGATALHYATLKGMALIGAVSTQLAVNNYVFRPNMLKLVEALLARGANPNARLLREPRLPGTTPRFSLIGSTPFSFATATGDLRLMRLLVQSGANPLLATNKHTTPLMVAAGLGNFEDPTEEQKKMALEAARMLVELGADVNAVDDYGWTALHGAAYTGADATVQFLVDKGAKLDIKDMFGQTPYSIAAGQIGAFIADFQKKPFGPHPSTMNLLRKLGADPFAAQVLKDSEGAPVPLPQP
jgi:ankyrin repeat protein